MNEPAPFLFGLLVVFAIVAVNAFFVASEIAYVSVRRSRVEQLARAGNVRARLLLGELGRLDDYIATIQLGVTMAGLALGWVGEPYVARLLEPALESALGALGAGGAGRSLAVLAAFALITVLIMVFGELAPKRVALQSAERIALWVVVPIAAIDRAFRPATWLVNRAGELVARAVGFRAGERAQEIAPEELEIIIQASARAGLLSEMELLLARRALEFSEIRADQAMVPRTEVVAIDVTATIDEVLATVERHQHTRYPVYEGDLDHVVGVLDAKRLLPLVARGETAWLTVVRPAVSIPASVGVDVAVAEMRRNRVQFLVLVDEHGGTAGILTADELLYRLLGRIGGEPSAELIRPLSPGNFLLGGLALVADVEDALGVELSDEDYDTVGGLVMARLGRIPRVGDRVEVGGYEFRVLAMDGRRVDRVLAIRKPGGVTGAPPRRA